MGDGAHVVDTPPPLPHLVEHSRKPMAEADVGVLAAPWFGVCVAAVVLALGVQVAMQLRQR